MNTKLFTTLLAAAAVGLTLIAPTTGAAQAPGGASDPATAEAERAADLSELMAEGAQVFSNNCGRCHNLRASTERSDVQWDIIVAHMRARANLTRSEAEAVKIFLQMTNGDGETPEPPTATSSAVPLEDTMAMLRSMERRGR